MKKRITIVVPDRHVIIDGQGFGGVDMTGVPENIRTVQWFGEAGEVEFAHSPTDDCAKPLNEVIQNLDQFKKQLDECEARQVAQQQLPTLDELKSQKNTHINSWRVKADYATFAHRGTVFNCDYLSRSRIDAVANHIALLGVFPGDWPGGWKAADNTYLEMPDVDSFKAFYQSMAAQITENFIHAQALKAQLEDAELPEDVAAIVW